MFLKLNQALPNKNFHLILVNMDHVRIINDQGGAGAALVITTSIGDTTVMVKESIDEILRRLG